MTTRQISKSWITPAACLALATLVSATWPAAVWAQAPAAANHSAHHGAAPGATSASSTQPAASDMASGEVRRLDKAAGKITLRHGEIKSLDMPPMTMVFQVTDTAWLDRFKVGDKVRFRADQQGGTYRVIELQPVP